MTGPASSGSAAGSGWDRLAQAVAEVLPPDEVDGVWIFTPLRRENREWGTAVLSRVDGERRRIYTARRDERIQKCACLAVEPDGWRATVAGLLIVGVAGELAAAKSQGPGSFAVAILDELHNLDGPKLVSHALTEIEKAT